MTLLAMWLGEKCVALATDSRMGELQGEGYKVLNDNVQKLHCVPSGDVMFAIGFDEGASDWLAACSCKKHRNYPEHWRECSHARNVDELVGFIRCDLQTRNFDPGCLTLYVAGLNEHERLAAFVLDGAGDRTEELTVGNAIFSPPVLEISIMGSPIRKMLKDWFEAVKRAKEQEGVEFPGARALEETGRQILDWCSKYNYQFIGGQLRYCVIHNSADYGSEA